MRMITRNELITKLAQCGDELEECKEENAELNHVFELQHSASQKAESMWRKATYSPNTIPGLGVLLEWLMGEIKQLHENENIEAVRRMGKCLEIAIDRAENAENEVERLKKMLQISLLFQRRHRKWALHELYMMRSVADQCEEDCKYHYEKAEKYKARVGELLAILQKHGIAL